MRNVFMTFLVMLILRFFAVFKLLQFIEGHTVIKAPIISNRNDIVRHRGIEKTVDLRRLRSDLLNPKFGNQKSALL